MFFELPDRSGWNFRQSSPSGGVMFSGAHYISADLSPGRAVLSNCLSYLRSKRRAGAPFAGIEGLGKSGFRMCLDGIFAVPLFTFGAVFDNSIAAIVPMRPQHLAFGASVHRRILSLK